MTFRLIIPPSLASKSWKQHYEEAVVDSVRHLANVPPRRYPSVLHCVRLFHKASPNLVHVISQEKASWVRLLIECRRQHNRYTTPTICEHHAALWVAWWNRLMDSDKDDDYRIIDQRSSIWVEVHESLVSGLREATVYSTLSCLAHSLILTILRRILQRETRIERSRSWR